jgi:hypothetical protein
MKRRVALQTLAGASLLPRAGAWQSFYYGKDEPLPRQIELAAGPLTMVFEPDLGFLRYLRYGDVEVIRGIYAAVRDRNWGTVAPRISRLRVESGEGAFQLSFDVNCAEGDIDFLWHGRINGDPAGVVTFRMEGEARSTFLRNRIGFCVLHPIEGCAGRMCTVMHAGGSKEIGKFPLQVSPHQPFKQIVSMSHEVAQGVTAEVAFEGEIFEMEDHRNWTDASYKTYCTPLELEFPVEVKQGAKIAQAVTVSLKGAALAAVRTFRPAVREAVIEVAGGAGSVRPLPRVGFGLAADSPTLDGRQIRLLLGARPAHLRVDLKLNEPAHAALLNRAIMESRALQTGLELALHLTNNAEAELKALAPKLNLHKPRVDRCLVFHQSEKSTGAKWVNLAREQLKGLVAAFGAGTNAYFAELNRGRPETAAIDLLCYSLNPQVHAFDNASLVENLAAQADAVDSARQFAGGKQIAVTPVSFKPRFNPNATGAETKLPPDVLPPSVDARQLSLFGAAWTVGSLKYLCESGAASVTYYETHGARGLMELAAGSRWPKLFPSERGMAFPLYHVLADVNELAGGEILRTRSSQPLAVDGLIVRKGNRQRALVANLTAAPTTVRVAWPNASRRVRVRKLDEHSVRAATLQPESWRMQNGDTITLGGAAAELSLAPYAVARIDTVES